MNPKIIGDDIEILKSLPLDFKSLLGKTVLITGVSGFLPAYLAELFMSIGENSTSHIRVIGLVRNIKSAQVRFSKYLSSSNFKLYVSDLAAPIIIDEPVDVIIHAASQASPRYYGVDPVGTLIPNSIGTYFLLDFARKVSCSKFLFFSTGEVYGTLNPSEVPTLESNPGSVNTLDFRSCYAESKRFGENLCISWHHQFGLHCNLVRIFHTYGPGMKLEDGRVFADFVKNIVRGENIELKSEGNAVRPFSYITDTISGILYVLFHGKAGDSFNIGNDDCLISIKNLAKLLAGTFRDRGIDVVTSYQRATMDYVRSPIEVNCPNTLKIRQLGWRPKVSIEEGFRRTVAYYE